jgi:hypothetical protein
MAAFIAHAGKIPEAVSHERPADAEVQVPELLQFAGCGQAAVL